MTNLISPLNRSVMSARMKATCCPAQRHFEYCSSLCGRKERSLSTTVPVPNQYARTRDNIWSSKRAFRSARVYDCRTTGWFSASGWIFWSPRESVKQRSRISPTWFTEHLTLQLETREERRSKEKSRTSGSETSASKETECVWAKKHTQSILLLTFLTVRNPLLQETERPRKQLNFC